MLRPGFNDTSRTMVLGSLKMARRRIQRRGPARPAGATGRRITGANRSAGISEPRPNDVVLLRNGCGQGANIDTPDGEDRERRALGIGGLRLQSGWVEMLAPCPRPVGPLRQLTRGEQRLEQRSPRRIDGRAQPDCALCGLRL